MTEPGEKFLGARHPRKEDRRLLAGQGRYVADIQLPGCLHVAFLRSAQPHGRLGAIDTRRARAVPGVVAILTGADLKGELAPVPGMQNRPPKAWREAVEHEIRIPDQPILADGKVLYVGEPIAVVVAESRYIAEDAAELIEAEIEALPPVTGIDAALAEGAAQIHAGAPGNVVARFRLAKGRFDALPPGLRRLRRTFDNHRHLAMPIECRGLIAQYDAALDAVTIWAATQVVHWVQREVSARLNLPESRVRCIAPDVGGGFGIKGHVYPEDILIPYLARRLGRPVRWLEDRHEHFLNSTHARDDRHDAEIVFDTEGRIHGLRDIFVKDSGAFTPVGIGALSNTATHILGPYHVPVFETAATLVVTNKTPNAPYRGTGRPEGAFVMERLLDLVARSLDLDPVEVRRRNLIPPEKMPYAVGLPYRDGVPVVYDSGNYPAAFEQAIAALGGLKAFRQTQQAAWREGRYLGLGVAAYVEGTGAGPFEGATVRIDPSGSLYVATGACAQGQGHDTVFSQIAADEWGLRPEQVTLGLSDTAVIAQGYGTVASRSAVNSSAAIRLASAQLRRKVLAIAAHLLECGEGDLELSGGAVRLRGVPEVKVTLREVAQAAKPGADGGRPPGISAGLEATEYYEPPTVTWSYATHAGIVEIAPETGAIRLQRYVVVHDAGVLINPMIAEGQIFGAICQGIGGALLEEVVYDEAGQLLSGTLADYLLPTASDMPRVEIFHHETPTPLNDYGIKGLGEGGVAAPPIVIANGVCDALRRLDFEISRTPVRPAEIVKALAKRR